MCTLHAEEHVKFYRRAPRVLSTLAEVQSLWCPLPGPETGGRAAGGAVMGGAVMAALGSFGGNWPRLLSAIPLVHLRGPTTQLREKGLDLILKPGIRGRCLFKVQGPGRDPKMYIEVVKQGY